MKAVSLALVLMPAQSLREQMSDDEKWMEATLRYGLDSSVIVKRELETDEAAPHRNGENFLMATTQLVNRYVDGWCRLAESTLHQTGMPLLVWIDEGHTGSEDNSWGETQRRLADAGACVVLVTATDFRADGKRIPGFDFETIKIEDIHRKTYRPHEDPDLVWVEINAGVKQFFRLIAHHKTTFLDAWTEDPSPLCSISRVPFDVEIEKDSIDDSQSMMLSELGPSEAVRVLGKLVRSRRVVADGVDHMVNHLRVLRQTHANIGAIVFCGNDEDDGDAESNQHPRMITREIERIAPDLSVIIATSANDGKSDLRKFRKGVGDVLVVKQMAGIGFDCSRLKVMLDLSSVRTANAFIQRLMRIATPHNGTVVGTYIAPNDVVGRTHFNSLVTMSGGDAASVDLHKIHEYAKKREDDPRKDVLYAIGATSSSDFEDSMQNRAEASLRPFVDRLMERLPALATSYTHAEVATRIGDLSPIVGPIPVIGKIRDTGERIKDLRLEIVERAKELATKRTQQAGYSRDDWTQMLRDTINAAKLAADIPLSVATTNMTDIDELEAVLTHIQRELNRYQQVTFGSY